MLLMALVSPIENKLNEPGARVAERPRNPGIISNSSHRELGGGRNHPSPSGEAHRCGGIENKGEINVNISTSPSQA